MLPIVYTPVVAKACAEFSHIYRRPRGLFIAYPLRDRIRKLLANRPRPEVDVIVVTDGERILGIGDQGVGGMGIPIGKLSLYSLIGGIHPTRTLPIVLDVGTNNAKRLEDPEYLGWRHERVTGQSYFDFIDQFVTAVKAEMPRTLLQWEDFATPHARAILDRYRDELLTFNDDIQGTAAVALGAISAGIKVAGTAMRDQQVIFWVPGRRRWAWPITSARQWSPKDLPKKMRGGASGSSIAAACFTRDGPASRRYSAGTRSRRSASPVGGGHGRET
jgi:malate dehydrogenase (oxaloacetate-decarboxylating)